MLDSITVECCLTNSVSVALGVTVALTPALSHFCFSRFAHHSSYPFFKKGKRRKKEQKKKEPERKVRRKK
jgi:hypothetical protein